MAIEEEDEDDTKEKTGEMATGEGATGVETTGEKANREGRNVPDHLFEE